MSKSAIPLQFARANFSLNWSDMLWGYHAHFLTWKDLVQAAMDNLNNGSDNDYEIEIASVGKEDIWRLSELVEKLASVEHVAVDESKHKWLLLSLAWAYENRSETPDPLAVVEDIYADFDYPKEMENFVRYMPPSDGYDPEKHSSSDNHQRLLSNWKNFLQGYGLK